MTGPESWQPLLALESHTQGLPEGLGGQPRPAGLSLQAEHHLRLGGGQRGVQVRVSAGAGQQRAAGGDQSGLSAPHPPGPLRQAQLQPDPRGGRGGDLLSYGLPGGGGRDRPLQRWRDVEWRDCCPVCPCPVSGPGDIQPPPPGGRSQQQLPGHRHLLLPPWLHPPASCELHLVRAERRLVWPGALLPPDPLPPAPPARARHHPQLGQHSGGHRDHHLQGRIPSHRRVCHQVSTVGYEWGDITEWLSDALRRPPGVLRCPSVR